MKNENNERNKSSRFHLMNLNEYERVKPEALLTTSRGLKYRTNGDLNSYFYKLESLYLSSPTTAAIIDQYVSWVVADGLEAKGLENNKGIDSLISHSDLEMITMDFKVHGNAAFIVKYNYKGEIARLDHVPVRCLAINNEADPNDDPKGYWYCFNWNLRSTYKERFIPIFGSDLRDENGYRLDEVYYFKRNSVQPLYALPDWQSVVQYAEQEMEVSNFFIKHIKNSFSAGLVININQGGSYSDEEMDAEIYRIKKNLSGTNGDPYIVAFNDNKDNATTVDPIQIPDAYLKFQFVSAEAKEKIMLGHKINDPSLIGMPNAGGFSSQAEQMDMALDILMRNRINPMRKSILNAFINVLRQDHANVELSFIDFPKFAKNAVIEDSTNMSDIKEVIELKKWRNDAVSSNVDKIMYNDESREMVIKFNDGAYYTYYDVDFGLFLDVMEGQAVCRTSGSNKWGSWEVGKFPSIGAAVNQLLVGTSYRKGGSLR